MIGALGLWIARHIPEPELSYSPGGSLDLEHVGETQVEFPLENWNRDRGDPRVLLQFGVPWDVWKERLREGASPLIMRVGGRVSVHGSVQELRFPRWPEGPSHRIRFAETGFGSFGSGIVLDRFRLPAHADSVSLSLEVLEPDPVLGSGGASFEIQGTRDGDLREAHAWLLLVPFLVGAVLVAFVTGTFAGSLAFRCRGGRRDASS